MSLKDLQKGDKVILCLFTGAATGIKTIDAVSKGTITITRNDGTELRFSTKTGRQVEPEPKRPRFANYIKEDDGSYVSGRAQGKKKTVKPKKDEKTPVKRKQRKKDPEPEPEEFNEEEYLEEE